MLDPRNEKKRTSNGGLRWAEVGAWWNTDRFWPPCRRPRRRARRGVVVGDEPVGLDEPVALFTERGEMPAPERRKLLGCRVDGANLWGRD